MHSQQLAKRQSLLLGPEAETIEGALCFSWKGDILPIGIIACYACAAADTLSSELGILARSQPRLIVEPTRKVPRGTNGGVTIEGLIAGLLGSTIIAFTAVNAMPLCDENSAGALGGGSPWSEENRKYLIAAIALWGVLGSLFDSWLGAMFQRSVKDVRTGKIVEGEGGSRAMTTADEEARLEREQKIEERRKENEAKSRAWMARTGQLPEGEATTTAVEKPAADLKPRDMADEKETDAKAVEKKSHSRVAEGGMDIFDNNDVNFAMSFFMAITAMGLACQVFDKTFESVSKA